MVVLLADDNRLLLSVLAMTLRAEGHEVLEADSGTEALEMCENTQPDVAVIDLHMPGVSGKKVAGRLRSRHIPFVFISAYDEGEVKAAAEEYGAAGYLVKPADRASLLRAIDESVASGGPSASSS
jgi:response regulator NasT